MAMTATIALVPASTAKIGQEINATLTISNSGGAVVNVTQIDPLVFQTGAPVGAIACATYATAAISGNSQGKTTLPVAASGSITVPFTVKFHAPSAASSTYSVGAVCYSDDGSVFSPTVATITVSTVS